MREVCLEAMHVEATPSATLGTLLPSSLLVGGWAVASRNSLLWWLWRMISLLPAFPCSTLKLPKKPYRISTSALSSLFWLPPCGGAHDDWKWGGCSVLDALHVRRAWLCFAAISCPCSGSLRRVSLELCLEASFSMQLGVILYDPLDLIADRNFLELAWWCGTCFLAAKFEEAWLFMDALFCPLAVLHGLEVERFGAVLWAPDESFWRLPRLRGGFFWLEPFSLCSPRAKTEQSGGRLNVAGCCRSCSLRLGEALNPGPRRSRFTRAGTLEDMPLLLPATIALEKRVLDSFCAWCRSEVKSMSVEQLFNLVPELLPALLRSYGDLMFQRGEALSNFRHLLLACQRWRPLCRPFMQQCWDIVARWEAQQPVQHRTPLPEAVVKALCVLGWMHGWYGWVLATAVSFYGGARLGEVLKCARSDLLLPCDLAEAGTSPVFMRLRHFKTKFRNPAKVQHLRIVDVTTCRLLHLVFRSLPKDQLLFDSNPYQYRKRWNLLLTTLQIPSSAQLTPGGLRGGFAVMAYRSGRSIQDIMWTMRLRSQVTLESYLQETASLNALVEMSPEARKSLFSASKVFPVLPAASS